ncbi:hypothetical protein QYF36_015158 [Acer negundo]|nr:hypothetical protein QYF36_015158 [Acer negundo]
MDEIQRLRIPRGTCTSFQDCVVIDMSMTHHDEDEGVEVSAPADEVSAPNHLQRVSRLVTDEVLALKIMLKKDDDQP